MANGDMIAKLSDIYTADPKSMTTKAMVQTLAEGLVETLDNDKVVNVIIEELSASMKSLNGNVLTLTNCHTRLATEIDGDPHDRDDDGLKGDVKTITKFHGGIVWALKIACGVLITGLSGMLMASCT